MGQTDRAQFGAGGGRARLGPIMVVGKKKQTVAVSLPVMDGKWWGPNWLWPLGTALTSAIGDKKKVPAGSLPDK